MSTYRENKKDLKVKKRSKNNNKSPFENKMVALFEFSNKHSRELVINPNVYPKGDDYPIMKVLDMYLWEIGFERGIHNDFKKKCSEFEDTNHDGNYVSIKSYKSYKKRLSQIEILNPEIKALRGSHLEIMNKVVEKINERYPKD
jgi:hypothetical protein